MTVNREAAEVIATAVADRLADPSAALVDHGSGSQGMHSACAAATMQA